MTRDQYTKVGVAAHDAWEEDAKTNPTPVNPHAYVYGFKAGAKTILDNPGEWGLASMVVVRQLELETNIQHKEKTELQSQLTKYREALEDVDIELSHEGYANSSGEGVDKARTIIKEALKQ